MCATIAALLNAVRIDETRVNTRLALGNLLFDSGQLDHALRCFECAARG